MTCYYCKFIKYHKFASEKWLNKESNAICEKKNMNINSWDEECEFFEHI